MSATLVLSAIILLLILVHYSWEKWQRRKKDVSAVSCTVPKGPRGHWLLGHASLPPEALSPTIFSWRKSHGPIFEVFTIPKLVSLGIFINDVELVKGRSKQFQWFRQRDPSRVNRVKSNGLDYCGMHFLRLMAFAAASIVLGGNSQAVVCGCVCHVVGAVKKVNPQMKIITPVQKKLTH